ncbi:GYF domain-containing protein [Myxococcus sp. Y35]|uniref:GYF domain-containing protein n=1 Tax=Pseudomyxococcus flavus TaxID=3115648 RepID=UPI003CEB589A
MAGNSGEDSANPGSRREAAPEPADTGSSPVLDGVSDAELDAIVGQLRTDKSLRVRPSAQPRSREAMQSERLHRGAGRTRASSLGEEPPPPEAPAPVKHAWYVVMGGAAYGPHDVAELKAHVERGALGPDSLCWREGFGEWMPLGHVPELASALLPPSVPPGAPPLPVAVAGALSPRAAVDLSEATTERVILEAHAASASPASSAAFGGAVSQPGMAHPGGGSVPSTPEASGFGAAGRSAHGGDWGGAATQAAGAPVAHGGAVAQASAAGAFPAHEGTVPGAATDSPFTAQGGTAPQIQPAGAAVAHGDALGGAGPQAAEGEPLQGASRVPASALAPQAEAVPPPVGTHAVLTSASLEARARRKRRLGILLAGGAVGGMSVALALGVFGVGGGRGAGSATDAVEAPPKASPSTAAVEAPASEAVAQPSPDTAAPTTSTGSGGRANPGASGGGSLGSDVAETARSPQQAQPQDGARASTPALAAVSVDRGGRVPELTGTESTSRAATGGTRSSPAEQVFERPTGSLSSRDVAVAFVIGKHSVAPALEPEPAPRQATTVAEAAVSPRSEDDLGPDEDFDRMLSGPGPNATKPQKRTVWVPPDPTAPRETLDLATVFAVVHSRRSELAACGREQAVPPQEGDRAVLRLSVLPSGKVESITTETPWLRGTPLVRCMQQKIGAWTFPRHRTQGAPVVFRYEF